MQQVDFSSWPRDQEQSFVVYEQRTSESLKKAMVIGISAAVGVLVLALGIYAGVPPDKKDITKDMNMSNLGKRTKKADADAPKPAPAPAAAPADKPADSAADKPADSSDKK